MSSRIVSWLDKILRSKIQENVLLLIVGVILTLVVIFYNRALVNQKADKILEDIQKKNQESPDLFYSPMSAAKDAEHDAALEKLYEGQETIQQSLERIEKTVSPEQSGIE